MIEFKIKWIKLIGLTLIPLLAFFITPSLVKGAEKSKEKPAAAESPDTDAVKAAKITTSASKTGANPDGTLRPVTPAEEKKLNAALLKTLSHYQKHQPEKKADGSLSLVVAPFSLSAVVAERTSDGKIVIGCTDELKNPRQHAQKKSSKNNHEKLPEE